MKWRCDYCGVTLTPEDWYKITFRLSHKKHPKHFMGHKLCMYEIKDRLHDPLDYTCMAFKKENSEVWTHGIKENRY